MNSINENLYNTLFSDIDNNQESDSIGIEIINSMYSSLNLDDICNYHDLTSYKSAIPNNSTDYINVLHINARSLNKNFDQVISFVKSLPKLPDVLCISETWLNANNVHLHEIDGYTSYHVYRPIGSLGGGVAIYVKYGLQSEIINDFCMCDENAELCSVRIILPSNSYSITCLYRPYSKYAKVNEFNAFIDNLLSNSFFTNNRNILTGDFNINLLEHESHPPTNSFISTMQSNSYFPHISRPTRFPDINASAASSLLDHIWINFNEPVSSGILHFPLSDHLPVFINIPVPSKVCNIMHKINFRLQNRANRLKFTQTLSNIDWNLYLTSSDTDKNCDIFLDKLYNIYYSCFPKITKTITSKRLSKPWLTQGLINSTKHKFQLYKLYKLGSITLDHYKHYRNYLNNIIKQKKSEYYLQKFASFRLNTKKIWELIKEIKSTKNNQNTASHTLNYNDTVLNTPHEISNAFNTYFSQIAPELSSQLPRAQNSHTSYLQGNFLSSMNIPLVAANDTVKAITALKNKKSNVDEIPVIIIKENKNLLAEPLSKLFNDSIKDGVFPTRFKLAKIIPIHKSGSKTKVSNYRPISILSVFSKIFEIIMKNFLMSYLSKQKILNNRQFGFRPGLNTFDAINLFTSDLHNALNNHKSIISIFIDFSKAFDTVDPNILVDKLQHYGIRGCVQKWFKSYLTGRSQFTSYNNSKSTIKPIQLGVPQGSILGPILFLLYINDICYASTALSTIQFADDSTLYMIGDNPTDLINRANRALSAFAEWCLANRLTINTTKTFYMLFTNTTTKYQPLPRLAILDEDITQVYKTKFLGITFDKNLTFKYHISNLCLKLSRSVALLLKIKNFVTIEIMKIMYYAHIFPHLIYCNPIWSTTYPCHLQNLNILHKKIIRIMSNSDFLQHTPPLFKDMNILQLTDLSNFSIASYMFKQIASNSTSTLTQTHNHSTRNKHSLQIPHHSLTLFQHSLMFKGPKIWNSIPTYVKESVSLNTFKRKLKDHLLLSY